MSNMAKILKSLLLDAPRFVILTLIQLLALLIFGIAAFLVRVYECLCEFIKRKNLKEGEEDDDECNPPHPEDIVRRPDPCIYSQTYLASQGVSITWNNPDIFVARAATPNVIEPDSYHLEADTDYVVSVRCHNASTDLALGVKVRLLYRPWSFNSPDLLPVETTPNGDEAVRFVSISGMGSTIAQFKWRTPTVAPGESKHFCLQAHLSHPMDINLENNIGQENTNVHSANPGHVSAGEIVDVDVPLFNHKRGDMLARFTANSYAIDQNEKVQLQLLLNTGREPWPLSKRIGSWVPVFQSGNPDPKPPPVIEATTATRRAAAISRPRSRFVFGRRVRKSVTRARYAGFDRYKKNLIALDVALPEGMRFETPGLGANATLAPAGQTDVPVRIRIPDDAQTGDAYSINVRADDDKGRLLGGVTFLLNVQN
ncbi:MAG: hypothetical protein P8Y01_00625 [Woeseiaceae bacterium]|jgi:hypothetical protein